MNIDETVLLIYIKRVKDFMKINANERNYLMNDENEDRFYDLLAKFSYNNWKTVGTPELSKGQFETIKKILSTKEYEDSEIVFTNDSNDEGDSWIFVTENKVETINYKKI